MTFVLLRGFFLLITAAVAALYLLPFQQQRNLGFAPVATILSIAIAVAIIIVIVDTATKYKRISSLSGIFLGLVAGLVAAYALSFVVDLVFVLTKPDDPSHAASYMNFLQGVKVLIGLITCYLGISFVLQTKDDFRFFVPYVEFSKQIRGHSPTLMDTSAIIDGRIVDITQTHIFQDELIIPRFVLEELQNIADSKDKIRRVRGRRGLDMLQKLEADKNVSITIQEYDTQGSDVDQKLINLSSTLPARIMTTDYNLNKVATLRGLEVINLNDLAKSLRPVVLPGEKMSIYVVKPGESHGQGIGYLDDGTMIVIEGGRDYIHKTVNVEVSSTLQTSAGKMIFSQFVSLLDDTKKNSKSTTKNTNYKS